jgi:type I restriction enzyme M protein
MSVNISGLMKSIRNIMREDNGLNGDAQRIEQLGWMLFIKVFSDKEKELEMMKNDYTSPLPSEYHWDEWAGDEEGMTGDDLLKFVDRTLFPDLRDLDVSDGNKRALIIREVFEGNHNYMKSGINLRRVLNKLNGLDFNIAEERHLFGDIYEGILKELQSAGKSGEFYTPRAVTQFLTDMINPQLGEKVLDPACGTGGFLTCTIEHLKKQVKRGSQRKQLQANVKGWEYKPLPFLLATTNLILHDIEVPTLTYDDSLSRPLNEYRQKDRVDAMLTNPPFGGVVANGNEKNFPQNFRTKESADLFLVLMIQLLMDGGRAGIVLPDGSLTGGGVKQRIREKWLTECNLHTIIRLPNSVFAPYATVATNLLFFEKGKPTKNVWYYEHKLPEGQKSYSKTKPIRIEEFDPIKKWWKKRKESDFAWKISINTIKERGWDLDIKNPNKEDDEIEHSSEELLNMLRNSFCKSDILLEKLKSELLDA